MTNDKMLSDMHKKIGEIHTGVSVLKEKVGTIEERGCKVGTEDLSKLKRDFNFFRGLIYAVSFIATAIYGFIQVTGKKIGLQ